MHLVLGLGNPGRRYEQTRHNAGFLVVDRLAERHRVTIDRRQLGALVTSVVIDGHQVVLAKPQSFMNLSGQPATSLRGFYKVQTDEVIVVHDDVDLPLGDIRVKKGGGHGGHNGLRDITAKFGSSEFVRVRFGVGRPPEGRDTADWVLASFSDDAALPEWVDRAADAVILVINEGTTAAMNRINARRREPGPEPGSSSR